MMNEIRQNQTWEVCPKAAKVTRRARVLNVLGNEVELLFLDHTIFPISLALSASIVGLCYPIRRCTSLYQT